jgi:hypothetical protein
VADLSGVRAKLGRADEHRRAYEELFHAFLETEPYSITLEYEPESGWHILRWQIEREPPYEELALIFGDMLSNLRTTLDYLVWQLVLATGREPGRHTGFPVARRPEDWPAQSSAALAGLDQEWVEEIQALQPYHWDQPELHPLAVLDHVNNLNKHRFLPPAVLTLDRFDYLITVDVPVGERLESRDFVDEPIRDGAELARVRTESGGRLEVHISERPSFRISFADELGHDWYPIELVAWVTEAVAGFERAFLPAG